MKPLLDVLIIALIALSLATACSRKAGAAHEAGDDHAHGTQKGGEDADSGGVSFKEGRGLALAPEVTRALSLTTAKVDERALSTETKLLVHVFAVAPRVLASASVAENVAERFENQKIVGGSLVRLDRASTAATNRVEAIFALERDPRPQLGEFVEVVLAGETRTAPAIPDSAVLDAASGTFAYVLNHGHYLRTAVKLGARAGGFVEIEDGLSVGDVVVATPVDQLWLAELRLTKGGGHSH